MAHWDEESYCSAKKGVVSANEINRSNGNRGLKTQQKISNVETVEFEINRVEKILPKQANTGFLAVTSMATSARMCTLGCVVQDSNCRQNYKAMRRLSLKLLFHLAVTSYSQLARINCVGSVDIDGDNGCLIEEGPWVCVGLPTFREGWYHIGLEKGLRAQYS